MGKHCKKMVVYPKMSTIFSKIVRKHCLHACDFFHVCPPLISWCNTWIDGDLLDQGGKKYFVHGNLTITSWKKTILVIRNPLLSQEINFCHILWLSYSINLQQHGNPTKEFAWAYIFRGNLVPRFPRNSPPCARQPFFATFYILKYAFCWNKEDFFMHLVFLWWNYSRN